MSLRLTRLLAVWAPLALTFLLVTGSTPVINAAINRLPGRDHPRDLAAFAVLLSIIVVLHAPLFVTREIAIKLSVDRAGARRALRFCAATGAVVALVEILVGATPLGARLLGAFADDPGLVAGAHRAFLVIWPVPILIAVRGVYQAHQIRADDTLFVGLGTIVRIGTTALLGFVAAPRLGWSGPILGAFCFTVGVGVETAFAVVRARRSAAPPERSDRAAPGALRFGLPLMFANLLGLVASLFYLRIAGLVPREAQEASLAAFQEVKPMHWFFGAGAVALQSLTTAKVEGPGDARAMLRFAAVVGGGLSVVFGLCAFTPAREFLLVDVLGEKADGAALAFAEPALMLAVAQPLLSAIRFGLRGVLISRGQTRPITAVNVLTLVLLAGAIALEVRPSADNGAWNAYVIWTAALLVEIALLARAAARGAPEAPLLPAPVRTPRESTAG